MSVKCILTEQGNKSAYQAAVENGYSGTETAFNEALAAVPGHIGNTTVHITAAERTAWNNKVDKVEGKGLSSNDFTTAEKEKLAGIAAGATNVVVDSELNEASTNPVQNTVVAAAISTALYTASDAYSLANSKAPMYTYSTTDLTAGTSPLATGKLYFVYT